jgi:hypothetical protein
MEFTLILYILLSAGIGIGGTMYLVQGQRTFGAFLYFVGAILILTFYGLRWFAGDSFRTTRYSSKSWPPVVNTCPDFLSVYEIPDGNKTKKVCVDLVGVALGGQASQLQKLTSQQQASDPRYQFNLHFDKQGKQRIDALCKECRDKGVTWEGVYDGVGCVATAAVPNDKGGSDSAENTSC